MILTEKEIQRVYKASDDAIKAELLRIEMDRKKEPIETYNRPITCAINIKIKNSMIENESKDLLGLNWLDKVEDEFKRKYEEAFVKKVVEGIKPKTVLAIFDLSDMD